MKRPRLLGSARAYAACAACALATTVTAPARAWTFPEHQRISRDAVWTLLAQSDVGPILRDLWAATRGLVGARACAEIDAAPTSACVPFAAWPALAADHACSTEDLLAVVRDRDWTMDVLAIAMRTEKELAAADDDARARENIRRDLNIALQGVDPLYAARAKVNTAHFQMAREDAVAGEAPQVGAYLAHALEGGRDANATSLYAHFHAAAILRAREAARARGHTDLWRIAAEAALLNEAFALHFLEDSFSAGHFVGTWGNASYRLGTHDFYSRNGVEARTWGNTVYAAYGDAFLSDRDARYTGQAVLTSLRQLALAYREPDGADVAQLATVPLVDALDVCTEPSVPAGITALARSRWIGDVVVQEPIPAPLRPELPRARKELGFFFGAGATGEQSADLAQPLGDGYFAKIRGALRFGYGAEALTAPNMSSQAFLEAGLAGEQTSQGAAFGFAGRAQAPWAFFPFDGALAIPMAGVHPDSKFWVGWAAKAGYGPFGLMRRTHHFTEQLTWQISALTDMSIFVFPSTSRKELEAPILTLRHALPLTGLVTTDLLVDVGPQAIWGDGRPFRLGLFLSLASTTRYFP